MSTAMCFVFGQIPINLAISSRDIPGEQHGRILSIKFPLNLYVEASVLPLSNLTMQRSYSFNTLFILIGGFAFAIFLTAVILPNKVDEDRMEKSLERKILATNFRLNY